MTDRQREPEKRPGVPELLREELRRVERGIRFRQTLRSTAFSLAVAAAVAVLLSTLLLPVLRIYGVSMEPTLREGEIVLAVRTGRARPGELIAFYYGNKVLIKRCLAVAGDSVEIGEDGAVRVNGAVLDEPYLEQKAFGECDIDFPYQVPEGRVFVLGDRRDTSIDSRNTLVGCVSSEQLIGRVLFRLWPLKAIGALR